MGAVSSIENGIMNTIYVSYDFRCKDNIYIRILRDELRKSGLNIVYSEITTDKIKHLDTCEISAQIKNIMKHMNYFIFCVSEYTIRSFHQTIEINSARECNKKCIYLMMDKCYTPHNSIFAKSLVSTQKWLPFYTDEHVIDFLELLYPEKY